MSGITNPSVRNYIAKQQIRLHRLAEKKKMQEIFVKKLKANKVSKWKEIIDAEFGVIRPQSVFRIPKKNGFYMLNEDDGSIGVYYKTKPCNKFRVIKREHILETYSDSFIKLAAIWDNRLDINIVNFNIKAQYLHKHEETTNNQGHIIWRKLDTPVLREYDKKGRPNILNNILHLISFRMYFTVISNNSKSVRLYITQNLQMTEMYLPYIYRVPLGQWISIPLYENKEIDIIKMRGRLDTLPHPHGEDFGEWRIVRAGALDEHYPNFFLMQHKCKGKRTYASVVPYLVEDLLKSNDTKVLISRENDRECWDCGEIITNEQCHRLITAQTISSM